WTGHRPRCCAWGCAETHPAAEELVPEAGFEPARPRGRGIFVPLRLSPPRGAFVVWSTPSPWPLGRWPRAVGARRLLSTPSRRGGLGSALARDGSQGVRRI